MLRVAGGEARGRKLKGPKGLDFRPTTGRVKEFMFSVLGPEIEEAHVLDLFSGSGSLGIEALSRGAAEVTFVEASRVQFRLIEQNLELCRYQNRARIIQGDVFKTVQLLGRQKQKFNIILADPPFKNAYHSAIAESAARAEVLLKNGILMIEHEVNDQNSLNLCLKLERQRRFGHCMVSIYEHEST